MSSSPLDSKIRRAQWRLWFNSWLHSAAMLSLVAMSAWSAVFLISRLTSIEFGLGTVALAAIVGILFLSTIASLVGRQDRLAAASALDQGANLKDRLASGVYCADNTDPFSQVVLSDANETAKKLRVSTATPLRWPRPAPWCAIPIAIAVVIYFIPPQDLFGRQVDETRRQMANRTRDRVVKPLNRIKKLAQKNQNKGLDEQLEKADELLNQPDLDPNEARRIGIKELTSLKDQIEKQRTGSDFDRHESLKDLMSKLDQPKGDSPTAKLQRALSEGDFKSAAQALQELKKQIASKKGKDSPEMKDLQARLDAMSRQLKELSKDRRIDAKLKRSGLSKEDIEKIKKMLAEKKFDQAKQMLAQKANKLSQGEQDKLMQKMKQQSSACQQCNSLGKKLAQAASAMGQNGASPMDLSKADQALSEAANMLSQDEMLEEQLKDMEGAMSELNDALSALKAGNCSACNGSGNANGGQCAGCGGSGVGPWRSGLSRKRGSGSGGPGIGNGQDLPSEEAPHAFKRRRSPSKTTKGKVIGSWLVDGVQVRGEAKQEFQDAALAAETEAEEAVDSDRVPRRYHQSIKGYFGNLAQRERATTPSTE